MISIIPFFSDINPLIFILWFLVAVILFFSIRELMLWYWRINENTESLKRIADSLEIIATAQDFIASDVDSKNENKNFVKTVIDNTEVRNIKN
jgi:hypothetical protein